MNDALENYEGGIKCGGLTINNLRFADDIDLIGCNSEEPNKQNGHNIK